MIIIGIVGGIGAGKSFISETFSNLYNTYVIELDKVGHTVMLKDGPAYDKVIALLGNDVLDELGEINREKVSNIVFENHILLEALNAIVHEEVFIYLQEHLRALKESKSYDFVICEAALLVVDRFMPLIDQLWYVKADVDIRIKRLIGSRQMVLPKIQAIMDQQPTESFYSEHADFIIENNDNIIECFEKISKEVSRLLEDLK